MTALPRLGHSPHQCCTLPGAGDHISALQTPQSTVLRAGDRERPRPVVTPKTGAALEQGCGCPQTKWPVSHSLSVPNTSDRVWVLCQTPAILCPSAVRFRLSPSRVPGHPASPAILCPLALFCAAPDDPAGTSCCQGRNGTSGTACLGPELIAIVPAVGLAQTLSHMACPPLHSQVPKPLPGLVGEPNIHLKGAQG